MKTTRRPGAKVTPSLTQLPNKDIDEFEEPALTPAELRRERRQIAPLRCGLEMSIERRAREAAPHKALPTFERLLNEDILQARALTPAERTQIAPAVQALENAIGAYQWMKDLARRGIVTGAITLDRRRKLVTTMIDKMRQLHEAINEITPHDQLVLESKGIDLFDLDARIINTHVRCTEAALGYLSGASGRTIDMDRRWLICYTRTMLTRAGIRCTQYRDGLFAAVLTRVLLAVGIEVPNDLGPDLKIKPADWVARTSV